MQVDGQCHCGKITFEAEIDPEAVSVCHCTDCQMLTGSAFRVTVLTRRASIRLTGNQPKLYTKTGDNGRKRLQFFCPECGSPLFTTGEGDEADIWGIRWGSIRQRRQLAPRQRFWCRSAPSWLGGLDDLPGRETE